MINLEKCTFHVNEIEFLGHSVSGRGALPLSSNVEAVQHFPEPATVKDMQVFLGMVNFYHPFIPNAASTLLPLTDCLRGGQPSSSAFVLDTYDDMCLPAGKSSPLQRYVASTSGPHCTYSSARGRFRHPRRHCSATTVTWQPELAPFRFLLQEAVLFPGEIECLRQGAVGLFLRHQALLVHPGGPFLHHLHRPQTTDLRFIPLH